MVARSLSELGAAYISLDEKGRAKELLHEALRIQQPNEDMNLAETVYRLAITYGRERLQDFGYVEELLLWSLKIRERVLGPGHPDVAQFRKKFDFHMGKGSHTAAALSYEDGFAPPSKASQEATEDPDPDVLRAIDLSLQPEDSVLYVAPATTQSACTEKAHIILQRSSLGAATDGSSAGNLNEQGWKKLCNGEHQAALDLFSQAIQLEPAAKYFNNRGITKEILGLKDFKKDYLEADNLTDGDAKERERLLDIRKWKPVGWEKGRLEARGEEKAEDADFLISFARPDKELNNKILHHLHKGVDFNGKVRPVTFCHDRSIGMGVRFNTKGEKNGRWREEFNDLDDKRNSGEFPRWFRHYKKAAEKTKHGILILQLTEHYFKSKPCRWEFGYVRRPELVHVIVTVPGHEPKIVRWQDLVQHPQICRQAFGVQASNELGNTDLTVDDDTDDVTLLDKMVNAAELVKRQEEQAWCELPLREVSYTLALDRFGSASVQTVRATKDLVKVLLETGQADRAYGLCSVLTKRLEESHGTEHIEVAKAENFWACACAGRKDYGKAINLFKHSLEIYVKNFEEESPKALASLNNLGRTYGNAGDYEQMKISLQRLLQLREKHLGLEHEKLVYILDNLAIACARLGHVDEAEELVDRSWQILQNQAGGGKISKSLHNLGLAYMQAGSYRRSVEVLELALARCISLGAEDHPQTALTWGALAGAYCYEGDYRNMKECLETCLRIQEMHFDSDEPNRPQLRPQMVPTLFNLSTACEMLGEFQRAIKLKEKLLVIEESDELGASETLLSLGLLYGRTGDSFKMEDLLTRSFRLREKHFSNDAPELEEWRKVCLLSLVQADLCQSQKMIEQAKGYMEQHNFLQAKELLERSLSIQQKHFGLHHRNLRGAYVGLITAYKMIGDKQDKHQFIEYANCWLKIEEELHGSMDPEVALALEGAAKVAESLGDYPDMKHWLERCLMIREKHFGADDLRLAATLKDLGHAYGTLGNFRQMRKMLERALKIQENHTGVGSTETEPIITRLAVACERLCDFNVMKQLVSQSLKIKEEHVGPMHPEMVQHRQHCDEILDQAECQVRRAKELVKQQNPQVDAESLNELAHVLLVAYQEEAPDHDEFPATGELSAKQSEAKQVDDPDELQAAIQLSLQVDWPEVKFADLPTAMLQDIQRTEKQVVETLKVSPQFLTKVFCHTDTEV